MSRPWVRVAVPVVVTIALLFFLLRAVRPGQLAETLSDVSPGLALLAALAAFGFIVVRAFRYRLLLGDGQPRRMRTILAVTLSSWGASLILPGPSGDAAFVMLARTRLKAPVAVGAGAAVLSRPALLVAATVAARVATGLQYFALFAAIDQALSLQQVWFALSIRTLLLAVPIQGLGGFGTTQLWWTAGLTLLGWSVDDAIAASLAVHLLDLTVSLPQAALGWLAVSLSASAEEKEQARLVGAQRR